MLAGPCTNVKMFYSVIDDCDKRHKRVERLLVIASEAIKPRSRCCCGCSDVDDNKDEEEREIGWTDAPDARESYERCT